MKSTEKSYANWYFLMIVAFSYLIITLVKIELIRTALIFSLGIFKTILPVFVLVFILMLVINYFILPKQIERLIGRSAGMKKWLVAIIGGIISAGPIYMWYPILKQLREQGVSYGFIVAFLYSRAIKIPMLPLLVLYFGLEFTLILTGVMIFTSLLQGFIFEYIKIE